MKVSVYGSGYVGLVVAACFAEVGNDVVCMDVDAEKIEKLNQGIIPIYEPGLEDIIIKAREMNYLRFTTDVAATVNHGECQFIAVGTPPDSEGKADLKYVLAVAQSIAQHRDDYTIIINKSTVPLGTADKVRETLAKGFKARNVDVLYDVVSNPEFLKEGAALEDFRKPDRVVLGIDNSRAEKALKTLYAPFIQNQDSLMIMDTRSAELTKYAANAMLATKISFMNEMANLAEKVGADIEKVRKGIGADVRIGYHFTHAGCGYGGSCFGKDIQALIHTAQAYDSHAEIVQAVERVNANQKRRIFEKIAQYYQGNLKGKVFAIWGLAFKPETDDMRDAPSLIVINELLKQGAIIRAFDPQAMTEAHKILGAHENLMFGQSPEEVTEEADALVILTEWRMFKNPDFRLLKQNLREPIIFDGRNIYEPQMLAEIGIQYFGIGRGKSLIRPASQLLPVKGSYVST